MIMKRLHLFLLVSLLSVQALYAQIEAIGTPIAYSPKSTGQYIGTPSILQLADGTLLASHDLFGPACHEDTTFVYRSDNKGKTWQQIAVVPKCFWAGLFLLKDKLYLLGVNGTARNLAIWQSDDSGATWSDAHILRKGSFHGSSTPVVIHNDRIYKGYDNFGRESRPWMSENKSFIMSASVDADLTQPEAWTYTDELQKPDSLDGSGWLETNVVAMADGTVGGITRLQTKEGMQAGYYRLSSDSTIDMQSVRAIPFPGGSTKFNVRYDTRTRRYWALTNYPPKHLLQYDRAGGIRCVLTLVSSADLVDWKIEAVLLGSENVKYHGFQYADWCFSGNDILFVSRTAYDDPYGGALRAHDANYLTFHRIRNYRKAKTPENLKYLLSQILSYENK